MNSKPPVRTFAASSPLRGRIVRFALIGVAATFTHVVTALALHEGAKLSPLWANFLAFCIAVLISYFGHYRWTFTVQGRYALRFPRFLVIALAGLGLNQVIVYTMVDQIGWPYRLALGAVVLIVPTLSFLLNQNWAFSARN